MPKPSCLCLAILALATFLLADSRATCQDLVKQEIEKRNASFLSLEKKVPFERSFQKSTPLIDSDVIEQYTLLNLDDNFKNQILSERSSEIYIAIPVDNESEMELLLYEMTPVSSDFKVTTSDNPDSPAKYKLGVHYWGVVKNSPNSTVAFSVTESDVFGNIYLNDETYSFGKLDKSEQYVIYQNSDLKSTPDFTCFTEKDKHTIGQPTVPGTKSVTGPENCVQYYLEIRYSFYSAKGSSVQNTTDYILGAFSQVNLVYAKEDVNTTVQNIHIWTSSSADPYSATSTGGQLNQFVSRIQNNISSYNGQGDLFHLIGTSGNGGIAYLNVLCYSSIQYRTGYSDINTTYNNLPSYSWTVEVLAHELGHNKGSPHTHDCSWDGTPGNGDYTGTEPLDNCGPNAGYSDGCTTSNPYDEGTVMSYCHLTNQGINLGASHPFGEEPGDLIRAEVYGANCLSTCTTCGEEGTACNDGSDCTTNDQWNDNCECIGIPDEDDDNDGVCNAEDQCPDFDDGDLGQSCDDGNECTTGETWVACDVCGGGSPADNDGDGVGCDEDPDDNNPCVPVPASLSCSNCSVQYSESFETGMGIWNDGGSDCTRSSENASDGTISIRLRDNTGENGAMWTDPLNLSNVDYFGLEFSFISYNLGNGEDFWIQISTNGGNSYTTVVDLDAGSDFANGIRYNVEILFTGINLSGNTLLRIMSDASSNSDQIFIDEVKIYYCGDVCELENTACNDNDPCTTNDEYDASCNCVGTPLPDSDGDGICNSQDACPSVPGEPGSPCNDGDPCTTNDTVQANCSCGGDPTTDTDGDGICNSQDDDDDNDGVNDGQDTANLDPKKCRDVDSDGCDDCANNPASGNSWAQYTPNPNNDGQDTDGDGLCDSGDSCPDLPNNMIGQTCNDGNDCTFNDVYTSNCNCAGTPADDEDGDGYYCDDDPDDSDPCNPDDNSYLCGGCQNIETQGFESGTANAGIWNDGGSDCRPDQSYPNNGLYCVRLRDNTGSNSSLYTDVLDLSGVTSLVINFSYYAVNVPNGQDFVLQISTNGGSSYSTVAQYISGTDFSNDTRYHEEVFVDGNTLNSNVRIRFMSNTSTNSNHVYLDDIAILLCGGEGCELEGQGCNDSDPCTDNDTYDANCNCVGEEANDADNDGICDSEDNCPDQPGEIGSGCDDGDDCTENDVIAANCDCEGTPIGDADGDGEPCSEDPDDSDPCDPIPCEGGCQTMDDTNFETGFGIWIDGGSDCQRNDFAEFANSGNYCVRLRDDTGDNSSLVSSNSMDFSGYSFLELRYHFVPNSMENGEEFLIEINNGGGWSILRSFISGTNMINGQHQSDLIVIDGSNLSSNTKIRFRCNASNNQDQVYVDDISLDACTGSSSTEGIPAIANNYDPGAAGINAILIPNPMIAYNQLNIQFDQKPESAEIYILNTTGKILRRDLFEEIRSRKILIDDLGLSQGTYFVRIHAGNEILVKKLVVVR